MACIQNGLQTQKNCACWKILYAYFCAYFSCRGLFIDILKRINCNDEKVINCWFFDWFIPEIDLFVTREFFSHFSIDGPVQCCPEKAILIQIRFFGWGKGCMSYCIKNRSWNLKEAFSEGCAICKPPAILGS